MQNVDVNENPLIKNYNEIRQMSVYAEQSKPKQTNARDKNHKSSLC